MLAFIDPQERLLKASLLIALYSVRSERAFCEELEYNLLFRRFLDMDSIEPSFDPTVCTKNRERLLKHEVGQQLFDEAAGRTHARRLLSYAFLVTNCQLVAMACWSTRSLSCAASSAVYRLLAPETADSNSGAWDTISQPSASRSASASQGRI
jgi:hypothetical protein